MGGRGWLGPGFDCGPVDRVSLAEPAGAIPARASLRLRMAQSSDGEGGPWTAQYVILAALSVYLVMQTMEAVIFRLLILSIPLRLAWWLARKNEASVAGLEYKRRPADHELVPFGITVTYSRWWGGRPRPADAGQGDGPTVLRSFIQ